MKRSILLVSVLCAVSIVAGALAPPQFFASTLGDLSHMLDPLRSLGPVALFFIIFLHNALKAFMAIVLGVAVGAPPLFFIVTNGLTIGALVAALKPVEGWVVMLAALAPHGIIEIPMILLSTALGLVVGWESLKWLLKRPSKVKLELMRGLKLYARWVVGGLLIASAIESFLTPYLVRLAGG